MIRKLVFCIMAILVVSGCSAPAGECPEIECSECRPVYVDREVEKIVEVVKTVEVEKIVEVEVNNELGPWTILAEITDEGMYLVPEEVEPGQWAFKAPDVDESCYYATYDELDDDSSNRIANMFETNKGFFQISEQARMIKFSGRGCIFYQLNQ